MYCLPGVRLPYRCCASGMCRLCIDTSSGLWYGKAFRRVFVSATPCAKPVGGQRRARGVVALPTAIAPPDCPRSKTAHLIIITFWVQTTLRGIRVGPFWIFFSFKNVKMGLLQKKKKSVPIISRRVQARSLSRGRARGFILHNNQSR